MEKSDWLPRGEGTYYARYTIPCPKHDGHEVTLHSCDALAWEMAQFAARQLAGGGQNGCRVLTWFVPRGYRPPPARIEPTASEIEDDIPF